MAAPGTSSILRAVLFSSATISVSGGFGGQWNDLITRPALGGRLQKALACVVLCQWRDGVATSRRSPTCRALLIPSRPIG